MVPHYTNIFMFSLECFLGSCAQKSLFHLGHTVDNFIIWFYVKEYFKNSTPLTVFTLPLTRAQTHLYNRQRSSFVSNISVFYTEQIGESLHSSICSHKSGSRNGSTQKAISEHFRLPGHSVRDLKLLWRKDILLRNLHLMNVTMIEQPLVIKNILYLFCSFVVPHIILFNYWKSPLTIT